MVWRSLGKVKEFLGREEGSSLILVIAFMALAIPLVTAALHLAGTVSVDSRVKTDIMKRQYASLGVGEYVRYQLPDSEWRDSGEDTILIEDEEVPFTYTPIPSLCSHCVLVEILSTGERIVVCAPDSDALSGAYPSVAELWPPNHQMVPVWIEGVPNQVVGQQVQVSITRIWQDEAIDAPGSGSYWPDAYILADGTAELRAERAGPGDGRVYHILFNAETDGESCSGHVTAVAHDQSNINTVVDSGPPWWDSTASTNITTYELVP